MINANFSQEAWDSIQEMLYAEGQKNPLEGQCEQRKRKEQTKQARTPAQTEADRARAQANQGKDTVPSATRSEAAKKGAETRRRCKGGSSTPGQPAANSTS